MIPYVNYEESYQNDQTLDAQRGIKEGNHQTRMQTEIDSEFDGHNPEIE